MSGQKEDLTDNTAKKELKPLRDFWNSDHLDENEKFLRDYILNKGTSMTRCIKIIVNLFIRIFII